MRRMTRGLALGAAAALLLAGCGASYDSEGYDLVTQWADEVSPAVEAAATLDASATDQRHDAADTIAAINDAYLERDDWPEDIAGWGVNLTQGDRTWQVDGEDLAPAVADLADASDWLSEQLRGDDAQELVYAQEDAQAAVSNLRAILTGRS